MKETKDSEESEGQVQRETLCLTISPSGEQAVSGGSDSAIHLYDLNTHQRLQIYKSRYYMITQFSIMPYRVLIYSSFLSSVWTVMDGHSSRVFAVTFHPERETEFISGGWDNTVQVNYHVVSIMLALAVSCHIIRVFFFLVLGHQTATCSEVEYLF